MRYAVVIERAEDNYAACLPDVPGCVAAGDTIEETTNLIREALTLHFESMRKHGEAIPLPQTVVAMVEVAIAEDEVAG